MSKKQKLELTWVGKEIRPKLEPRILRLEEKYSVIQSENFEQSSNNKLIFGDNLLALKALEQEYSASVKCIYIDPPYNTGSAFEHYDDGIEHSIWLSLIRDRLELLKILLSTDGLIFVQVDDNEGSYLRVLMDEVFGRANFVATFVWRKVDSPNDNKVFITPDHEYIICFAKEKEKAILNRKIDPSLLAAYHQRDASGRLYRDRLLKKNGKNSMRSDRPSMFFPLRGPDGIEVFPIHDDGKEARWAMGMGAIEELISTGDFIWKNRGSNEAPKWVPYSREYAPQVPERPFPTIWTEIHTTRQAKAHQKDLLPNTLLFDTPKPEPLIQQILELATNPGDLVLDSFAGSGTTGAVAHKMGRRWIMIELGEHCHTHIIPRLKKVIDGQDPGGITEAVGWKGGGGFRYYRLAPSLLEKDAWDNLIISKEYNPAMLAEAVCRHMGFSYEPSTEHYWMHGKSSESDFIYVTTATLTSLQLRALSEEVGEARTLLICCKAFTGNADQLANLTLKKIPNAVLRKCEWGCDDYSLNVSNLPESEEPGEEEAEASVKEIAATSNSKMSPKSVAKKGRTSKVTDGGLNLFDAESAA